MFHFNFTSELFLNVDRFGYKFSTVSLLWPICYCLRAKRIVLPLYAQVQKWRVIIVCSPSSPEFYARSNYKTPNMVNRTCARSLMNEPAEDSRFEGRIGINIDKDCIIISTNGRINALEHFEYVFHQLSRRKIIYIGLPRVTAYLSTKISQHTKSLMTPEFNHE